MSFFSPATVLLLFSGILGAQAPALTTVVSFGGNSGHLGDAPATPLVQGLDGNLYGTTSFGVNNGNVGTIYRLTPDGRFTTIFSFNFTNGANPNGLTLGTDGNLYGTTYNGGTNDYGAFFKITQEAVFTVLYNFTAADGQFPTGPLVQATDGNFYGTTESGGTYGYGTVFRITPEGVLTTLHSFHLDEGNSPEQGVVQAVDGNLYGSTESGGPGNAGVLFSMTPSGTFRRLTGATDTWPTRLIQGNNGYFYGTTRLGSLTHDDGYGSAFEMTASGLVTTLHSFKIASSGVYPNSLIQASNGKFYGTAEEGGTGCAGKGCGTIFSIDSQGTFSLGYKFHGPSDGSFPTSALFQATNGTIYGTTYQGGTKNYGTIFLLSAGLKPFVRALPPAAVVGTPISILGTDLTGATSVIFNGVPSRFTVVSPTQITTTVPTGATTGKIEIVTPSGTLFTDIETFRVLPVISGFQPASGPAGTTLLITGESLMDAHAITFSGDVPAPNFTVHSSTQISVTVPAGAGSGPIKVTTPGGTVTSSAIFTVK